jgi:hypothetical protein
LVNNDTQVSNDYEETRLALRVPQEALVLEDFAEIVSKLKGGDGSLDKRYGPHTLFNFAPFFSIFRVLEDFGAIVSEPREADAMR